MKIASLIQSAPIAGVALILMTATASASSITYNTNAAGTVFTNDSSLTLNNTAGATATLTYIPDPDTTYGIPSNVDFGNFTLSCAACTTLDDGIGSTFGAFTFDLIVTDVTDSNAQGEFVGSSVGGAVYSNLSGITINWAPLVLGPGTTNAMSGDFQTTYFTTTGFTGIVAPNSGGMGGESTIQGFVGSTAVPEPATLTIIGGSLLCLGLLRRKKISIS